MSVEPIRDTVVVFRCPFCRRSRRRREATAEHMTHCFKNPERTPRIGELSRDLFTAEDPLWWPGEGKIYDGKDWLDVPGYKDGMWPDAGGRRLDHWPLSHRLSALFPEKEDPAWKPEF